MSAWQMARRLFDSEGTEISYDEERESVSEQMSLTVKMGSGVLRIRENDDVQEKWTCGMARLHVCEMRISQVLVKMYVVSLKEQASTLLSGRNCCESVQLDLVTASAYEIPQINPYSVYLFLSLCFSTSLPLSFTSFTLSSIRSFTLCLSLCFFESKISS